MTAEGPSAVWRVRAWIRGLAVAFWLWFLAAQFSTMHFVSTGDLPESEAWWGWMILAASALAIALVVFRPFVAVDEATVTLQGPIGGRRFPRASVVRIATTSWGLEFELEDGTRATSIVCQPVWSRGEPRWFDVAERVLGVRPPNGADEVSR